MPPKRKIGKSFKAKLHKARANTLNNSRHHGGAARQFSAIKDDEYVSTGSSLSDPESAVVERGDTTPGIINNKNGIYCVTRIEYSS